MRYIFPLFLLISMNSFSQWKSFELGVKGDTLNRLDFLSQKQGRWVNRVESLRGESGFEEQGVYVGDKKEGTWQTFSLMGDALAIENYRWGNKHGRCMYFTPFGQPVREESWKAVNPDDPYETVPVYDLIDPTKVKEWVVVKLDGFTLKHGTWKYFDPEYGTVIKTEKYYLDKLTVAPINEISVDSLETKADSIPKKSLPKPQSVLDYEKKKSGKKVEKSKGDL